MRKVLRNTRGFTLVEALTAVALLGIASAVVTSLFGQLGTFSRQVRAVDGARLIKDRTVNLLNNEQAWQAMLVLPRNSTALNCLALRTDCAGSAGPFSLIDAAGTELTNHTVPGAGLDHAGNPCSGFNPDPQNGNSQCPFRVDLSWQAVCSGPPPCLKPEMRVIGLLQFNPSSDHGRPVINTGSYSFDFMRGKANSMASMCGAFNGVYDPTTNTCRLQIAGKCPLGIVTGVDPVSKTKTCRIPFTFSCPAGTVMLGVRLDGTTECAAKNCVGWAPPVGWTDGFTFSDGSFGDGGCDGSDGGCDGGAGGS